MKLGKVNQAIEEKIWDNKRGAYNIILAPIFKVFTGDDNAKRQALKIIKSPEYISAGFDLVIYGNEQVVKAYNELMQFTYKLELTGGSMTGIMEYYGKLILAIRNDLIDDNVNLNWKDMLRFKIKDIDRF